VTRTRLGQIQAGRRAAGCALLAAAVSVAACKRRAPTEPPRRWPHPEAQFDASALRHVDASANAAVRKAIAEMRERRLRLSPARVPPERLAFAPHRFAQLKASSLAVWDVESGKKIVELPVTRPHGVIMLADGSLLVAGATSLERLAPDRKKPDPSPHVTLFAQSRLIADRADPFAFFTLHAFDSTLYKYRLPGHERANADAGAVAADVAALLGTTGRPLSGLLPMSEFVTLDGTDHRALAELKDGSFLYTTKDGFSHFFAGAAKHVRLKPLAAGPVWRLLGAARLDEFWAALDNGEIDRAHVAETPHVVQKIKTGSMVYDVAANDHWLASVQVAQPDGGLREWKLVVYDYSGKVALTEALPAAEPPPAGENWVQAVTQDRGVALSATAPLVAVGGPTRFSVWNIKTQQRVFGAESERDAGK
jgi:hypothetical protein